MWPTAAGGWPHCEPHHNCALQHPRADNYFDKSARIRLCGCRSIGWQWRSEIAESGHRYGSELVSELRSRDEQAVIESSQEFMGDEHWRAFAKGSVLARPDAGLNDPAAVRLLQLSSGP